MDFLLTDSSIIQIHTSLTTSSILFWNLFKNFRLAADNLCQTKICLYTFFMSCTTLGFIRQVVFKLGYLFC